MFQSLKGLSGLLRSAKPAVAGEVLPAGAAPLVVHDELVDGAALDEEVVVRIGVEAAPRIELASLVLDRADGRDRLELAVVEHR
jgi:hypothetical protein